MAHKVSFSSFAALIPKAPLHAARPPLDFLVPCLANRPSTPQQLSTSSALTYPRDGNRNRGISPLRRTGLRHPVSMSNHPLPQPITLPAKPDTATDAEHGLWGFFNTERTALNTPEQDILFGRSWSIEELRNKSWEDLHKLWWACCRERNKISTMSIERKRLRAGYGDHEAGERDKTVRKTQVRIKQVLTQRYYAWEDALNLAKADPRFDLTGEGPLFDHSRADEVLDTGDDMAGENEDLRIHNQQNLS